jgi:two-component system NtrC family sensor kinase
MHCLEFLDSHVDRATAFEGSHDPILVALSIFVASLAAYAALGVAERIGSSDQSASRRRWLLAGSIAMGLGVWAMHFIGMLAFRLPIEVTYNPFTTMISILPATLVSAVVLLIISRGEIRNQQLIQGGVLMGLGIGTMHYIGMAAMRTAARMLYDPPMFALSVLVAMGLATLALHTNFFARSGRFKLSQTWTKLGASLVMGLAVSGMHYTGMAAVYFFPSNDFASDYRLSPTLLASLVAAVTAFILGLAILGALVDRRLKAATRSARMSQNRLMEAIESISEGFCLYDQNDCLVVSNSRYRELVDDGNDPIQPGDRFETILRRTVSRGLIRISESQEDTWIAQRLDRHRRPLESFVVERRSDGRYIRISERKTQEGGTVGVYTDITELSLRNQELEAVLHELRHTQDQLMMKEKMASLGQMAAGICHEVNNPIGAINSAAQLSAKCVEKLSIMEVRGPSASADGTDAEVRKLLDVIHNSSQTALLGGQRIAKIVASMRRFSGLDRAEFQKADIHEALDTSLMLLDHKLKDRVTVLKQYGELPEIYCYTIRLNQVFMNLLLNAAQAIEGKGIISVQTESTDQLLRVTITDSGKGIAPEHIGRVFEPGFTTKGVGIGTGMGLSICYSIVQDHGGHIGVTSQIGSGSSFEVVLPRDLARRASPAELKLYQHNTSLAGARLQ